VKAAPAKKLAVLTCMDARLDPRAILGLEKGDAHVIRNAGGVVSDDAIRSLAISQHLLGTEEILVIQHTGCGLLTFTDEEFAQRLEHECGSRPEWRALAFTDLERSVRDSVASLRECPFLPRPKAKGFVFDIETAELREVE